MIELLFFITDMCGPAQYCGIEQIGTYEYNMVVQNKDLPKYTDRLFNADPMIFINLTVNEHE